MTTKSGGNQSRRLALLALTIGVALTGAACPSSPDVTSRQDVTQLLPAGQGAAWVATRGGLSLLQR